MKYKFSEQYEYPVKELESVDQESYIKAKQLVQKELGNVKIDKSSPLVNDIYEKSEEQFQDLELWRKFTHNDKPLVNALDMSKYDNIADDDFKSIYTKLSYETRRLRNLESRK